MGARLLTPACRLGPAAATAAAMIVNAAIASAQTADDLFNRETVHGIRLSMNSRDNRELREHYEENTYYTADRSWRGLRVRNAGVRSRATGAKC